MTTPEMQYSKIAVLMAAYNGMEWISEQVDSILNQEGVDVTLYISVDLSNDGTEVWVKELAETNKQVIMLPYGARFGGAAPNFFRLLRDVEFSDFDAISFSDQDDVWLENKLQHAIRVMKQKQVDVVSSDVIAFWADGRKKIIKKSYPKRKFDHFFEAAGPGCTYVFNNKSALAFQAFLHGLGEEADRVSLHDWLAYAFCCHNGFSWYIDDYPQMLYRQHMSNQVGTNSGFLAYKKRIELVWDHWYRSQVEIVSSVINNRSTNVTNTWFMLKNFSHIRRRFRDRIALLLMVLFRIF